MDNLKPLPAFEQQSIFKSSVQFCIQDKPLVLAVDDDEDNLLLLTSVLEELNCCLLSATDGQTTLTLAQTYQPSLILLDILLPDFNGLEVIRKLRQNPKTQNIPVVAVTALARAEDKQRVINAGGTDYLSKPYMLNELEALVQRYLQSIAVIS